MHSNRTLINLWVALATRDNCVSLEKVSLQSISVIIAQYLRYDVAQACFLMKSEWTENLPWERQGTAWQEATPPPERAKKGDQEFELPAAFFNRLQSHTYLLYDLWDFFRSYYELYNKVEEWNKLWKYVELNENLLSIIYDGTKYVTRGLEARCPRPLASQFITCDEEGETVDRL